MESPDLRLIQALREGIGVEAAFSAAITQNKAVSSCEHVTQILLLAANAYANTSPPDVVFKFLKGRKGDILEAISQAKVSESNLTTLLRSIAIFGYRDTEIVKHWVGISRGGLESFTTKDLALIMWSFSRMGIVPDQAFLEEWQLAYGSRLNHTDVDTKASFADYTNALFCAAKLGIVLTRDFFKQWQQASAEATKGILKDRQDLLPLIAISALACAIFECITPLKRHSDSGMTMVRKYRAGAGKKNNAIFTAELFLQGRMTGWTPPESTAQTEFEKQVETQLRALLKGKQFQISYQQLLPEVASRMGLKVKVGKKIIYIQADDSGRYIIDLEGNPARLNGLALLQTALAAKAKLHLERVSYHEPLVSQITQIVSKLEVKIHSPTPMSVVSKDDDITVHRLVEALNGGFVVRPAFYDVIRDGENWLARMESRKPDAAPAAHAKLISPGAMMKILTLAGAKYKDSRIPIVVGAFLIAREADIIKMLQVSNAVYEKGSVNLPAILLNLSYLACNNTKIIKAWLDRAEPMLEDCDVRDLSAIIWSLGKLRIRPSSSFIQRWEKAYLKRLNADPSEQNFTKIAAYNTMQGLEMLAMAPSSELFRKWQESFVKFPIDGSRDIADIVYRLAVLYTVEPKQEYRDLAKKLLPNYLGSAGSAERARRVAMAKLIFKDEVDVDANTLLMSDRKALINLDVRTGIRTILSGRPYNLRDNIYEPNLLNHVDYKITIDGKPIYIVVDSSRRALRDSDGNHYGYDGRARIENALFERAKLNYGRVSLNQNLFANIALIFERYGVIESGGWKEHHPAQQHDRHWREEQRQ